MNIRKTALGKIQVRMRCSDGEDRVMSGSGNVIVTGTEAGNVIQIVRWMMREIKEADAIGNTCNDRLFSGGQAAMPTLTGGVITPDGTHTIETG